MTRHVIIEVRQPITAKFVNKSADFPQMGASGPLRMDPKFSPVAIPNREALAPAVSADVAQTFGFTPRRNIGDLEQTYILRGTVDEGVDVRELLLDNNVVRSFRRRGNPTVYHVYWHAGSRRRQTGRKVAWCDQTPASRNGRQGCIRRRGRHRRQHGVFEFGWQISTIQCSAQLEATQQHRARNPGHLARRPRYHVHFDVCIAAPKCTLLDIAVLLSQAPGDR